MQDFRTQWYIVKMNTVAKVLCYAMLYCIHLPFTLIFLMINIYYNLITVEF